MGWFRLHLLVSSPGTRGFDHVDLMAEARRTLREVLEERGQLDDDVVAVRLGGRVIDLHTPIDPAQIDPARPESLELIRRGEPAALPVIRHSTAHIMADAVQRLFPGTQVTIGPAIESGFYYDFYRPDGPFSDGDLARIEKEMRRVIKAKRPFVREPVTRDAARQLFEGMGELYKLEILNAIPEGEEITLYRHGSVGGADSSWVDLCTGPHIPHTGHVGAFKLTSVAGAYWRGDEHNPMLHRIYGTAFATQEELDEHLRLLAEARARDHRKLGKELELFMFHDYAPAMPFFLPRGAAIYRRLVDYLRGLYVERGYEEVITPEIFDQRLFQTSGHLENFREHMYLPVTAEALDTALSRATSESKEAAGGGTAIDTLGQKPMNCPSHCLIFAQRRRSYRELPWRVADFGRLHRYERGGVVHGLARVRSFCQDDAHIFCRPEQVHDEITAFNCLLFEVYRAFDFKDVAVKLALRPEKRMGTDEQWDHTEALLRKVLLDSGIEFEEITGEGAFYGPKLEFHVVDALKRSWQLGTIQVDPIMPERFDLEYVGPDGNAHRPIMLHRAVFGSIERFLGMYIEHCAGHFPVWLAPEQAVLVTVSERQEPYASQVQAELRARGLRVLLDAGADKLGAKIRAARTMRHPYVVVIGDKEAETHSVSPRARDHELGLMTVEEFARRLIDEGTPPRLSRDSR